MAVGPLSLLFINQHYHPDVASTGQHLTDLAEYLAARGHRVHVLCSRGKYLSGALDVPACEVHNGVRIRRVRATALGRGNLFRRAIDNLSFYVRALVHLLTGPRHDGVILLTTPSLLAFLGYLARRMRGQRYGIWSMDLHPEIEVALGIFERGGLVTRLLWWMSAKGYEGADFVVALGPHMKRRLLERGVAEDRIALVPVWSDSREVEPGDKRDNPLARELGLEDRFVVGYSGNAGLVHEFGPLLEAMRELRNDPRFLFLFIGGGTRRSEIEAYATDHAIGNFRYLDYFPRERLRHSLTLADVHVVSLKDRFVGLAVPGKIYGIMAAGRPILYLGPEDSEIGETVLEHDCGRTIDPRSGGAGVRVRRLLEAWVDDPARCREMGKRGRAAFLSSYDRESCCRAWTAVVKSKWGSKGA